MSFSSWCQPVDLGKKPLSMAGNKAHLVLSNKTKTDQAWYQSPNKIEGTLYKLRNQAEHCQICAFCLSSASLSSVSPRQQADILPFLNYFSFTYLLQSLSAVLFQSLILCAGFQSTWQNHFGSILNHIHSVSMKIQISGYASMNIPKDKLHKTTLVCPFLGLFQLKFCKIWAGQHRSHQYHQLYI